MSPDDLRRDLAHQLGAAGAWVLAMPSWRALQEVRPVAGESLVVSPLRAEGEPVACVDLRALGVRARERGVALVVDGSLVSHGRRLGLCDCASVRLGAHVGVAAPCEGWCVVAVSRDVGPVAPGIVARLDELPAIPEGDVDMVRAAWQDALRCWRTTSDAAQVVASFLRCHPGVAEVRYPGLRGDRSFPVASRTLQHGFGPLVDYRVADGPWCRVACDTRDVREQVMSLERSLA